MSGQALALILVGAVHVLAVVVLLWMLFSAGDRELGLGWWLRGDDPPNEPPAPGPVAPGGAALPLPRSRPSAVRLRGPGRLADAHPAPLRRPGHAPEPAHSPDHA
jgi:hypothetical protein